MAMPDPARALEDYRARAHGYDRSMGWLERYRRMAVGLLGLRPGEQVVDAGCGTGLSLPVLKKAIGPSGRISGVEQSPEMLELARCRVAEAGWTNVTLTLAPVQEATLPPGLDAALFCFTHDVVRTPEAVANVMASLRRGARFVSIGAREWHPMFGPINFVARNAIKQSITTFEGLHRPWSHLEAYASDLRVRFLFFRWIYLAAGRLP